jgi:hypothetical protein
VRTQKKKAKEEPEEAPKDYPYCLGSGTRKEGKLVSTIENNLG